MSSDKKLLLFASGNLQDLGGVQRSYQILTQHLIDQGWNISLVTHINEDIAIKSFPWAYPLSKQIKPYFVPARPIKKDFEKICTLIESIDPSLALIVNSAQNAFIFSQALHTQNKKYVYSIRGSSEYCLRYLWPCMRTMEAVFLRAAAAHVLMPSYKAFFRQAVQDKITVIPSQIEPAQAIGKPDTPGQNGRYVILYSGRFSFEKRIHLLIKAFAELKDDFPEWDLWLYGTGPLEDNLKTQVDELGLNDRIIFGQAQNTEEMYAIYPTVNIKALPSEAEGCPMALREAMSHGIPVVAYKECSGTNEILTDGEDGLLVENDDLVSCLAHGLRYLMERPELRKKMGLKGRETAAIYHPDVINRQWAELLESALASDRGLVNGHSDKENEQTVWAASFLEDTARKNRYRNVMLFDRDHELLAKHKDEYATIYGNRLFDVNFYLQEHPEVKIAGVDPLLHYVSKGWKLGYNPSPEFDSRAYAEEYLHEMNEVCPLYHYYREGRFSGCKPQEVQSDYYEKFPGKKPTTPYSAEQEAKNELKLLKI